MHAELFQYNRVNVLGYLHVFQCPCTAHGREFTIQTKSQNKIVVSVLDHKGAVNGRNLSIGQVMSVVVHDHDTIAVSAEAGTRVTLQNMGTDPIQASCST